MKENVSILFVGEHPTIIEALYRNCVLMKNQGVLIVDYREYIVCKFWHLISADDAPVRSHAMIMRDAMSMPAMMVYEPGGAPTIQLYDPTGVPQKALWIGDITKFTPEEILFSADGYGAALS